MNDRVGIILQARMGSTRLPGKVLMPFRHTTLLGWILERLRDLPWPVVVATSNLPRDDDIEQYCRGMDASCFRGSEGDVLDRYFRCAQNHGFDHVIRLTGDNPFPDIEMLRILVETHLENGADYTHSFGQLPVGTGAEIFSFVALERSWKEGTAEHHREHVNEYVLDFPSNFHTASIEIPAARRAPDLQLTIDSGEDYLRVLSYLNGLADVHVTTEELIRRCSSSV